jgi:hypothetical protein
MAYDIRPSLYSATQPEDEGYLARPLQNLQLSLLRHSQLQSVCDVISTPSNPEYMQSVQGLRYDRPEQ